MIIDEFRSGDEGIVDLHQCENNDREDNSQANTNQAEADQPSVQENSTTTQSPNEMNSKNVSQHTVDDNSSSKILNFLSCSLENVSKAELFLQNCD